MTAPMSRRYQGLPGFGAPLAGSSLSLARRPRDQNITSAMNTSNRKRRSSFEDAVFGTRGNRFNTELDERETCSENDN